MVDAIEDFYDIEDEAMAENKKLNEDKDEDEKEVKTEGYADARPNETALIDYLEGVGTLDGSPAARLATDLLSWMSDDEVKRFAEVYEYPIFEDEEDEEDEEEFEESKKVKTESNKCSLKTFNEALTKYFKHNYKTIESVKVTKLMKKENAIKLEAKLTNVANICKNVCYILMLILLKYIADSYLNMHDNWNLQISFCISI